GGAVRPRAAWATSWGDLRLVAAKVIREISQSVTVAAISLRSHRRCHQRQRPRSSTDGAGEAGVDSGNGSSLKAHKICRVELDAVECHLRHVELIKPRGATEPSVFGDVGLCLTKEMLLIS